MTIPCVLVLIFVPESPRWLLTKGREAEGIKVSEKMARMNRRAISEDTWEQARKAGKEVGW